MDTDALKYSSVSTQDFAMFYDDENDRIKHMAYITAIAQEKHIALSEVVPFYEHVLGDLRGQARIHDYLNIFVTKRVLQRLKGAH